MGHGMADCTQGPMKSQGIKQWKERERNAFSAIPTDVCIHVTTPAQPEGRTFEPTCKAHGGIRALSRILSGNFASLLLLSWLTFAGRAPEALCSTQWWSAPDVSANQQRSGWGFYVHVCMGDFFKRLSILYSPTMKQASKQKIFPLHSLKRANSLQVTKVVKDKTLGLNLSSLLQNMNSFKWHNFFLPPLLNWWDPLNQSYQLSTPRQDPGLFKQILLYFKFLTEQKQSHCRKKQWNKGGRRWWTSQGRCRCQTMVPRRGKYGCLKSKFGACGKRGCFPWDPRWHVWRQT